MKKCVTHFLFILTLSYGEDILINSFTDGNQRDPNTSYNNAGYFVVTWKSDIQNDSGSDIRARLFNNDINPAKPLSPKLPKSII